jgi:uncharacterized protein YbjT (DUF2867 family)
MTKTILVCGATGRQGGAVAQRLMADGHAVRALTRRPGSAAAIRLRQMGAAIVIGDMNDEASLKAALEGADGVFAMQTPYEEGTDQEIAQGMRLNEAARVACVAQVVYSSVANADLDTGVAHYHSKGAIERHLATMNFAHVTVLRPTLFMEMFLMPSVVRMVRAGRFDMAIRPTTRLAMVAVADIAAAAARAFAEPDRFNGLVIDLAGDQLTLPEIAAALSAACGTVIRYAQVPPDALPADAVPKARTQAWFDTVGWKLNLDTATQLGLPQTSFAQWAQNHRHHFMHKEQLT